MFPACLTLFTDFLFSFLIAEISTFIYIISIFLVLDWGQSKAIEKKLIKILYPFEAYKPLRVQMKKNHKASIFKIISTYIFIIGWFPVSLFGTGKRVHGNSWFRRVLSSSLFDLDERDKYWMTSDRENIGYWPVASQFSKVLTVSKTFKTERTSKNTFGLKFSCVCCRITLGTSFHSLFHRNESCGWLIWIPVNIDFSFCWADNILINLFQTSG